MILKCIKLFHVYAAEAGDWTVCVCVCAQLTINERVYWIIIFALNIQFEFEYYYLFAIYGQFAIGTHCHRGRRHHHIIEKCQWICSCVCVCWPFDVQKCSLSASGQMSRMNDIHFSFMHALMLICHQKCMKRYWWQMCGSIENVCSLFRRFIILSVDGIAIYYNLKSIRWQSISWTNLICDIFAQRNDIMPSQNIPNQHYAHVRRENKA